MQLQIGVAARRVLSAHLGCDGLRRVRLGSGKSLTATLRSARDSNCS